MFSNITDSDYSIPSIFVYVTSLYEKHLKIAVLKIAFPTSSRFCPKRILSLVWHEIFLYIIVQTIQHEIHVLHMASKHSQKS